MSLQLCFLQNYLPIEYRRRLIVHKRQSKEKLKINFLKVWGVLGSEAEAIFVRPHLLRLIFLLLFCAARAWADPGVTLYSLDPDRLDPDGFHGYRVLGEATLRPAPAEALLSALQSSFERPVTRDSLGCFVPRHGLKVGEMEYLICFECESTKVYSNRSVQSLPTHRSGAGAFRAAVRAAGLPYPGWDQEGDAFLHCQGWTVTCKTLTAEATLGNAWLELSLPNQAELRLRPADNEAHARSLLLRLQIRGRRAGQTFREVDTLGMPQTESGSAMVSEDSEEIVEIAMVRRGDGWLVYQTKERRENRSRASLWSGVRLEKRPTP